MQTMLYPVLGELLPNPSPFKLPGDKFRRFQSTVGVHGLAHIYGDELHILAVASVQEGIGLFRNFVTECQNHYQFIRFWCVMNPDLATALARYGFKDGHDVDCEGVMQVVYDWRKS